MGTLQLSDLQTEVIAGLGNRTDIALTRIVNVLNLAQSKISRFYDFTEMDIYSQASAPQSQTSNDKYLVLPPLLKTIHTVVLQDSANSRKLVEKPWRMFDDVLPLPEYYARGWPQIYTRWGSVLTWYPLPLSAYTIVLRYTSWPTPFNANFLTQSSDFDNKDDIILSLTFAYFFRTLGRFDLADRYESQAHRDLQDAVKREDTRPDMNVSNDIAQRVSGMATPYWANAFVTSVQGTT